MVTDQQIQRLMILRTKERSLSVAAAKAGMSEKTARKYIRSGKLPSQMRQPHTWRTRINPCLKRALEQALLLRGHRDFASREEYERFLEQLFSQLNRNRHARFQEEQALLQPLPAHLFLAPRKNGSKWGPVALFGFNTIPILLTVV